MTWDGMVTNYHRNHLKEIGIADSVEAYIQTIVLKKTLESISFEYRRGRQPDGEAECEPTPSAGTEQAGVAQACTVQSNE